MSPLSPSPSSIVSPQTLRRDLLTDAKRLQTLEALGLCAAEPEVVFDRPTRLAQTFMKAPIALLSFVDGDRQWFKAAFGLSGEAERLRETPLTHSFCQYVVMSEAPLIVSDSRQDCLLRTNCAVEDLGVRAYLGVPVRAPNGIVLGAFVVIDHEPREWTEDEVALAEELAQLVMSELGARDRRRQAELGLQASEDRLQQVLGWADCLVWEAEVTLEQASWIWRFRINHSGLYYRLFEAPAPPSEVELWDRLEVPERAEMDDRARRAMERGETGYHQVFRVLSGSKTFWLRESVTVRPLGEAHFWVIGVATDITALKELETRLEEARDEALVASRLKSEFLANMSHEIRTPMNGVMGMLKVLGATKLDEEQIEMAALIEDSAEALLQIINEILDFSKIEAGKLTLETEAFDPRELVEAVGALLKPVAREQGLSLVVDCTGLESAGSELMGDPLRLRQILFNLAGNAVKFVEEGSVRIAAVLDRWEADTAWVRFEVTDTGPGIPASAQAFLFEPFVQGDGSLRRKKKGTGLGLAIAKQLAERMGGSMAFTSTVGVGSCFWVDLPFRRAEAADKVEPSKPAEPLPPKLEESDTPPTVFRLLMAEDNATNRLVAEFFLRKLGHRVTSALDGSEALRMLAEDPYDAVLMDCQMPTMDGFEATERIRRGEVAGLDPEIPIIALTAHALVDDRRRCLDAGMNDYVSKPISLSELSAALKRCGIG